MINSITIGNYQSFKDKNTLHLVAKDTLLEHRNNTFKKDGTRYLKVISIFGANASGKSNFLKGLLTFRQFVLTSYQLSLSKIPIPVKPFMLNSALSHQPSYFEIEIKIEDKLYKYGFEADQKKIHSEWLIEFPYVKSLFNRKSNVVKRNSRFKEYSLLGKKPVRDNVLVLSQLAQDGGELANKLTNAIQRIEIVLDKGTVLDFTFNNFAHNKKYAQLIKDFTLAADFNITDLEAVERAVTLEEFMQKVPPIFRGTGSPTANFFERQLSTVHRVFDEKGKHTSDIKFNFFDESIGTQQFFAISGAVINAILEGKILFIDELDTSLHSHLTRFILKQFINSKHNPNKAQLVFTSHDTNILDEGLLRRDQIVFIEKNALGASELYSLLDIGERKDRSFEGRYLEGRYGAIPFISELQKIHD